MSRLAASQRLPCDFFANTFSIHQQSVRHPVIQSRHPVCQSVRSDVTVNLSKIPWRAKGFFRILSSKFRTTHFARRQDANNWLCI